MVRLLPQQCRVLPIGRSTRTSRMHDGCRLRTAFLTGATIVMPPGAAAPDATSYPRIDPQIRTFLANLNRNSSPFWEFPGPQVRAARCPSLCPSTAASGSPAVSRTHKRFLRDLVAGSGALRCTQPLDGWLRTAPKTNTERRQTQWQQLALSHVQSITELFR